MPSSESLPDKTAIDTTGLLETARAVVDAFAQLDEGQRADLPGGIWEPLLQLRSAVAAADEAEGLWT